MSGKLWNMALVFIALLCLPNAAQAATPLSALAPLAIEAPIVLRATIVKTQRISAKDSPGLAPGHVRLLVTAGVSSVLVAPRSIPAEIKYLLDVQPDSRKRLPKLRKADVLLFLAPNTARDDFYRLLRHDAQLAWTAEDDATLRRLLTERQAPEMRDLRLVGIGNAFNVPGNLPGEGESQIFLKTQNNNPISLVVLSSPGQAKRITVAAGDIIDEAAKPIVAGSLLWYHLACTLPDYLPAKATEGLDSAAFRAVTDDYAYVRQSLGPCR